MKKFKKIYIEITNICNLSCSFCPKTKREPKFLNYDEFKKIIDSIKKYTDYIYFHLMGEPFLNKNLEKFFEYSKENGLKVNITTNGTLINNVKDTLLNAQSLRQINISLHSFEANDLNIELKEYIENITSFIKEANEKSNIICAIRLWNMDNEDLKAENSLNKDILKLLEEGLDLNLNLAEELVKKERLKLKDRVYLNMAKKFQWPDVKNTTEDDEIFCYGLRDQLGVLVDGTVVPCCLDSEGNIPLGNIFEEDLDEILASKRVKDIYDGFSRRKAVEELCKKCGYAKRYKIK